MCKNNASSLWGGENTKQTLLRKTLQPQVHLSVKLPCEHRTAVTPTRWKFGCCSDPRKHSYRNRNQSGTRRKATNENSRLQTVFWEWHFGCHQPPDSKTANEHVQREHYVAFGSTKIVCFLHSFHMQCSFHTQKQTKRIEGCNCTQAAILSNDMPLSKELCKIACINYINLHYLGPIGFAKWLARLLYFREEGHELLTTLWILKNTPRHGTAKDPILSQCQWSIVSTIHCTNMKPSNECIHIWMYYFPLVARTLLGAGHRY